MMNINVKLTTQHAILKLKVKNFLDSVALCVLALRFVLNTLYFAIVSCSVAERDSIPNKQAIRACLAGLLGKADYAGRIWKSLWKGGCRLGTMTERIVC
jgi:hypothetical protein